MEILFVKKRNRGRGKETFCVKTGASDFHEFAQDALGVNLLQRILNENEGYQWRPVENGYAHLHNLPLIIF